MPGHRQLKISCYTSHLTHRTPHTTYHTSHAINSVKLPCQINVAPSDGHKFQEKTDFSFTFHNLKTIMTGDAETHEMARSANKSANSAHQIPALCLRAQATDHQQYQALHVSPRRITTAFIAQQSHESRHAGAASPDKLSAAVRLRNLK